MKATPVIVKTLALVALLGAVVGIQFAYDAARPSVAATLPGTFTPGMVRIADMGFHPAIASFLWASTLPEILDLFKGRSNARYFEDLAFLNAVDPKMSYPYAFSVLTLPAVPSSSLPTRLADSFAIGERGLRDADADWRIPYYMAINYYLELKDIPSAVKYFDIAAATPGVPDYAKRFGQNFGISQRDRDRVRGIWETVYESSNDPATKERAAAYVQRLDIFDFLEDAAKIYRQKFGAYPASPEQLVEKGILTAVPPDPFGYTFTISADGTAGIVTTD